MRLDVTYQFNDFRLIPTAHELWKGDLRVALPQRVLACLCYLIEHRERAVGRDELIAAVWHRDNVSDIQLGQLILRTRRAVDDEGNAQHSIRTVVGYGYRWVAPTEANAAGPAVPTSADPIDPERAAVPGVGAVEPAAEFDRRARPIAPARSHVRPLMAALALAVLATLAAVATFIGFREQPKAGPGTTLAIDAPVAVLPLQIGDVGTDAAWLRLGGMDMVADRLRRSGLAVTQSESTLRLLGAFDAADVDAIFDRLHRLAGTALLITGKVTVADSEWRVALQAHSGGGTDDVEIESRGKDSVAAVRAASERLLTALGRPPPTDGAATAATEFIQRARAALLADDPARARRILEGAPASIRDDPELRFYLAQSDARGGRFAAAEQALGTLLADVSAADDPRLRMRALAARGLARLRIGHLHEAKQDFAAAVEQPRASAFVAELGKALNGRAITEIALHEFDAGNSDLGRARVQLERAGDALGVARVDANLGLLEYERGALAQAISHLTGAARRFEAFASTRDFTAALSGVLLIQLAQLDNHAALATSDRLWAGLERTGDPVQRRALTLRRATALLAVGRIREGRALLDDISAEPGQNFVETRDRERLQVLRTGLALREGRADDAAREAALLPDAPPAMGDDDLSALGALLRGRALPAWTPPKEAGTPLALGDPSPAAAPLRALGVAERAARAGQPESADRDFRKALALAEAGGVPAIIATVAASYAPFLLAAKRIDDAAAVIGRVSVWAADDFDCALLQVRLALANDDAQAWTRAMAGLRRVAGERVIASSWTTPPPAIAH